MASLGGRTFVTMTLTSGGGANAMGIVEITREGVDGDSFLLTGRRGSEVTYETMTDVANAAALASEFAAYVALKGTKRTLSDDHGNSYEVVVMDVTRISERRAALFSGGAGGSHVLRAAWTLRRLS